MTDKKTGKTQKKTVERVKGILFTLLALAFWVCVWWFAAWRTGKSWILPTPGEVLSGLLSAIRNDGLFRRAGISFLNVMLGFSGGLLAGCLLAVITSCVKALHILFSPLLTVVRATPVASFILILWVFLDRNAVPAVCVALIVIPIVWANCEEGILQTDKKLKETAKVYGFSFGKTVKYLYLPSIYPYFKTAFLTALGMAWKAGIAAEVLCTPKGSLGQMIWYSKRDFQTVDLFAWTLTVIAVCFALEKLAGFLLSLPYKRKAVKK